MDTSTGAGCAAHEAAFTRGGLNEHELLLKYVRRGLGFSRPSLSAPPDDFNWSLLLDLAHQHEVVPLLSIGLRDAEWLPAPVRSRIVASCRAIVAHNLSLTLELADVLDALKRSGITAVPFKGPAWTKLLYGNLADRQIADLDLFVERSEMAHASRVLCDRGYVPKRVEMMPPGDAKDVELFHPDTGIHFELHWSACEVWRDHRLAYAKLWTPQSTISLLDRQTIEEPRKTVAASLGSRTTPQTGCALGAPSEDPASSSGCTAARTRLCAPLPSRENIFLLLAIHGFRDHWESLKWLCDIAVFVQVFPNLNWNSVLFDAAKLSRKRLVLLPLALIERLFQIELPSSIAGAIVDDPTVAEIAEEIHHRNYTGSSAPSETQGVLAHIYLEWIRIQMRDSVFERFGLHLKFLFNLIKPNEKDRSVFAGRLPEPIYWFLRPYCLLRRHGLTKFSGFSRHFVVRSSPVGIRISSSHFPSQSTPSQPLSPDRNPLSR